MMTSAEQTMETLWHHHEAGHLKAATVLLRGLDYSNEAVDFTLDPNSYYFPNVRHDTIVRPLTVSPDLIPVVDLERSKTYYTERPSLHELQRVALRASGFTETAIQGADNNFASQPGQLTVKSGQNVTAYVRRQLAAISPAQQLVESKPIMIFNYTRGNDVEQICTGVVLHELVHIAQTLSEPLNQQTSLAQKELEAYAVHACLVDSFVVEYTANTRIAGTIDRFRRTFLGDDRYKPDDFFMDQAQREPVIAQILSRS